MGGHYRASVVLCLDSQSKASAVAESLRVDASQPAAPAKGFVEVRVRDYCVELEISSDTLSGLRALLNSYLYLAHAAWDSLAAASEEGVD